MKASETKGARRDRSATRVGWSIAALLVIACGDSTNGPRSDFDSGGGGPDTGGGVDSTSPFKDGSFVPPDSSTTNDGGSVGEGGGGDAAFNFDGFSKGDGNLCFDDDKDGWTTCNGDCNDHDSLINPCAFDTNKASGDPVGTDGIDNDCDGTIDNRILCDGSLASGHSTTPGDYASAVDVCDNQKCTVVKKAAFYGPNNSLPKRITKHMGSGFQPRAGSYLAFLSTGIADDLTDNANYRPGDGTDLFNSFNHPDPLTALQNKNPCGQGQDESLVSIHDYTEVRLTLVVPINAGSFTFDFNFLSMEYPAYACRGYNDTFLAMLTSNKYKAPFQIAFDPNGGRINVNNSFFVACNDVVNGDNLGYTHTCTQPLSTLNGTGYEIKYGQTSLTVGNLNKGSGGTNWLKTTAPVEPGETVTVSFIIFDEGDGILDSAVNVDNFRWGSASIGSPVTGR